MMGGMERDWAQLGRAMARARRALGLSQIEVADAIGVTRTPIQGIERGNKFTKVTGTMRSYARLLGWADGSIEAVLAGGEPTPAKTEQSRQEPEPSPPLALAPELPLDVRYELSAEAGPVIGATVLAVPGASPGSRMIVVMKGAPDASPEKIREDLLAWSAEQRRLRALSSAEGQSHGIQEA